MTKPNEPAFNERQYHGRAAGDGTWLEEPYKAFGLTKREYFAAMAMQALLTGCSNKEYREHLAQESEKYNNETPCHYIGELAASQADVLIEELNKPRENKEQ